MTLQRYAFFLLMVALPLVAPTNDWCSSNGTADCNNDGTAMCVYKLNKDGSSNEFKKITPECKTSATADNKCKPATVSATPEVAINEDELCCTKPKAANEHVQLDTKCVRMIGVLTNLTWRNKRINKTGGGVLKSRLRNILQAEGRSDIFDALEKYMEEQNQKLEKLTSKVTSMSAKISSMSNEISSVKSNQIKCTSGTVWWDWPLASKIDQVVYFSTSFKETPSIVLGLDMLGPKEISLRMKDVTRSQFTAYFDKWRCAGYTTEAYWLACGV